MGQRLTYLGIDETTLSMPGDSLLIVAAETDNPILASSKGYKALQKSKDILRAAQAYTDGKLLLERIPEFPPYEELVASGLKTFHWMRTRAGRFSRTQIEHAGIAHVVVSNGYKPQSTVLLVDAFHTNYAHSRTLLKEYLHARGFPISEKNIDFIGGGDQSVPIVNYADLLAFQIGLQLLERYRQFHPKAKQFPLRSQEIAFDERRMLVPIGEEGRRVLEEILRERREYSAA